MYRRLTIVVLLTLTVGIALSQDGQLDPTFNGTGKVMTNVGFGDDWCNALAVQTDGKIVAAGYSVGFLSGFDFSVVRYTASGSLDDTFSGDGKVTTGIGSGDDYGHSVVIQPDGKIIVAGESFVGGNTDFSVVRYNADGSLDSTFSGDGKVTTAIKANDDEGAYAVALQPDGKIVVVGGSGSSNSDFAVVRYNADGSLDNTFDGDGKVITPIGTGWDRGFSVALQGDGKIVVAGGSSPSGGYAVVRYNPDGSLDNTFDGDGKVRTQVSLTEGWGFSVGVQANGRILVAGYADVGGANYDFAAVRYDASGTLDNTFDTDGIVTTAIGSGGDVGCSLSLQADGKILLAGYSSNGSNDDFAAVRYNADGNLDNTFDGDGKVMTPIGSGTDQAYAVALQSNGKILAAGCGAGSDNDFAVVRYTGSSGPLPIQLASFTGRVNSNGRGVVLEWMTISEVNNYGFDIQRRREHEREFTSLAGVFIPGHGTTNEPQYYSYTDMTVAPGTWSYRLKQIDLDGTHHYSDAIVIAVPGDSVEGPIIFRLTESDGQVWSLEIRRDTSWHHFNIPLAAFGSGSEFLNTPVTKFLVIPVGGGGLIGGPLTEVADWIDDVVLADSLIDNFNDGDYSDWFLNIALNGSYLGAIADSATPNGSPRCMKLMHGNTMSQTFGGWTEKRFTGLTLSPNDTLKFWLRGKSYLITDVPDVPAELPRTFALDQNYPNPFNPSTTISYELPAQARVTLKVYDVLGREVAMLVNGVEDPGYKSVQFDGGNLASGVYLYRLNAGSFVAVKKSIVVK